MNLHPIVLRTTLIPLLCGLTAAGAFAQNSPRENNQRLWYRYPARYWNSQALHLGNGYFGASFYGGVREDRFSLTEKSIWTGGPALGDWEKAGVNPKALSSLPKIRQAVLNNEPHLADSLVEKDFFGDGERFGYFSSIGDLYVRQEEQDTVVSDYERSLDLRQAIGRVSYRSGKIRFDREYFCSYPDRVLALRYRSSARGAISFLIGIKLIQDTVQYIVHGNTLRVLASIRGNDRPFEVQVRIKNTGGKIVPDHDALRVVGADSVEIYVTIATSYRLRYPDYTDSNYANLATTTLDKATGKTYAALKRIHVADYRKLYDRVQLQLQGDKTAESLPTNERFARLRKGRADPGYKELAFNLGRYLIISSSRPGTLPANLQGVWNVFGVAPWAGNYQSNINLQEIYWSCGPTDLPECQQAYIDWIEDLAKAGREVARRVYGTDGWVSHTTGNIWGHAAPIGNLPWGMYPMGAAWHCQHVWEQFAFTQDTNYLRRQAWPLLKDASVFWMQNLQSYGDGLIAAPSVSAEHGALQTNSGLNPAFHDLKSDQYRYNLRGNFQDIEMARDLFSNTLRAARILGYDRFADSVQSVSARLPSPRIGRYGQLQEWLDDIDNPDCHHRHIAHLYAVCPGNQIHPLLDTGLSNAAKKALDMRGDGGRYPEQEMASGGNWARAHRMWAWTRLMDGNRANKIMTELLTQEGFENGLTYQHADYHWNRPDLYTEDGLYLHFQLDASASLTGCIAEMLLQSQLGELDLLPALPAEFRTGQVRGLKARGNYTVDLVWKNGQLLKAVIHAANTNRIPPIRLGTVLLRPGDPRIVVKAGE